MAQHRMKRIGVDVKMKKLLKLVLGWSNSLIFDESREYVESEGVCLETILRWTIEMLLSRGLNSIGFENLLC